MEIKDRIKFYVKGVKHMQTMQGSPQLYLISKSTEMCSLIENALLNNLLNVPLE